MVVKLASSMIRVAKSAHNVQALFRSQVTPSADRAAPTSDRWRPVSLAPEIDRSNAPKGVSAF